MLFAQQAIFDREGAVVGYELLYRAAPHHAGARSAEPEVMASTVLVSAFLDADLRTVLDGRPAYVNVSREFLVNGVVDLLDRRSVVIEILETIPVDPEIIGACQRLKEAGYRLALDDFVAGDPRLALLPFAEVVKVDVLAISRRELGEVARALSGRVRLLAEKVEDAAMHEACARLGFEMFQGYFYRRPKLTQARILAPDLLRTLTLMNLLRDPGVPQAQVVREFQCDPALTLRLVRMANVAAVGARDVSSIAHAIGLLGRGPLYRWLALIFAAAAAGEGGLKRELLRETVARARFCELLAERSAATVDADPGEAFLAGLFSRIEALLELPLATVLAHVRIAPDVRLAVTDGQGSLAWVLSLASSHEAGDWQASLEIARTHGVDAGEVEAAHMAALAWTRESLNAVA